MGTTGIDWYINNNDDSDGDGDCDDDGDMVFDRFTRWLFFVKWHYLQLKQITYFTTGTVVFTY